MRLLRLAIAIVDSVMTQWIAPTKMSKEIAHGLQWLQRQSEFDRDHRAIMLACSREKYLWTSYSTLAKRSGLDSEVLEKELKYLCQCGVLYIYVSEEEDLRRVLFALRERVEQQEEGFEH